MATRRRGRSIVGNRYPPPHKCNGCGYAARSGPLGFYAATEQELRAVSNLWASPPVPGGIGRVSLICWSHPSLKATLQIHRPVHSSFVKRKNQWDIASHQTNQKHAYFKNNLAWIVVSTSITGIIPTEDTRRGSS